jgi:hypothetical protein
MMTRFSRPAEALKYVFADDDRVFESDSIVAGDMKAPEYFPEKGDAVSGTPRSSNVSIQALGVGFSFTSGKQDLTGPLDPNALNGTSVRIMSGDERKTKGYSPRRCPGYINI